MNFHCTDPWIARITYCYKTIHLNNRQTDYLWNVPLTSERENEDFWRNSSTAPGKDIQIDAFNLKWTNCNINWRKNTDKETTFQPYPRKKIGAVPHKLNPWTEMGSFTKLKCNKPQESPSPWLTGFLKSHMRKNIDRVLEPSCPSQDIGLESLKLHKKDKKWLNCSLLLPYKNSKV